MIYTKLIDSCQVHLSVQYAPNIKIIRQMWHWFYDWHRATPESHVQNKPFVYSIGCPCSHWLFSFFPFTLRQNRQYDFLLKGTATLMISMFYQKELYEPLILIQVSSKSVEKWTSYGHLKNSIWPTVSRHFEYLISFHNFFNCLIFSYHYYHIICVSADM